MLPKYTFLCCSLHKGDFKAFSEVSVQTSMASLTHEAVD